MSEAGSRAAAPDAAWRATGTASPLPPPEPTTDESLRAMDRAAQATAPRREVASESVSCPRKWVEVTLLGEDGEPIADAECRLSVPGGEERQGRTGAGGVAVFEGIAIDPTTSTLRITAEAADDETRYSIEVVPLEEPPPGEEDPGEEPDEGDGRYFRVPWEAE